MIRVDLMWAIAGLLGGITAVVFIFWAFYNSNGSAGSARDGKDFEQCPYCTYVFFSEGESAVRCPRCRSFLKSTPFRKGDVA